MAITFIYSVKSTGASSLEYDTENKTMKIEKKENSSKNDSQDSLNYVMRDKRGNTYLLSDEYLDKMKEFISYDDNKNVVFKTITSSVNCGIDNTYEQWCNVRNIMNEKNGNKGNLQYCIVQNFGTDLNPKIANEIGVEFAKRYLDKYQVVISTHINTGYVHNHIEFNATSFIDGKKFNDNLQTVREIRNVSDELCREYGLEILEDTKDFEYIFFRDSNGKLKTYEPTKRKDEHKEGNYSDTNDYRNTDTFKRGIENEDSHITILQADMDKFIPYSNSYEELLKQLENIGYTVKAKTKAGEWRKHISFTNESWGKAVRDTSLDEFYHRINLSKFLEQQYEKKANIVVEQISDVSDFSKSDIYVYGRIIIDDIDEEYKYKRIKIKESDYTENNHNENDTWSKSKRSDIEKYIIKDTKTMNNEINDIVKKSLFPNSDKFNSQQHMNRKQYLINRINENLRTLKFVEDKEIHSFKQINDIIGSLCEKRNTVYNQVKQISNGLKLMNRDIVLIDKFNNLQQQIYRNSGNEDYVIYEKNNDEALLREISNELKNRKLHTRESQEIYVKKYKEFNERFLQLTKALEKINVSINEYDRCIKNIGLVDKKYDNKYKEQIEEYYETKKSYNNGKGKDKENR